MPYDLERGSLSNLVQRRVLIVEDEPALALGLRDVFDLRGFEVVTVSEGLAAARAMRTGRYDIILGLRAERDATSIVFLTAREREDDKAKGLSRGGDGYVIKPFGIKELLAQVEALRLGANEILRARAGGATSQGRFLDSPIANFERRDSSEVTVKC